MHARLQAAAKERARFLQALAPLLAHTGPKIIITDSQVGGGGVGTWQAGRPGRARGWRGS